MAKRGDGSARGPGADFDVPTWLCVFVIDSVILLR